MWNIIQGIRNIFKKREYYLKIIESENEVIMLVVKASNIDEASKNKYGCVFSYTDEVDYKNLKKLTKEDGEFVRLTTKKMFERVLESYILDNKISIKLDYVEI